MRSDASRFPMAAALVFAAAASILFSIAPGAEAAGKPKKPAADPYAEYVWPPPPDQPRIRLTGILSRRADVEAESKLAKALIGTSPQGPYEQLTRPIGCAFDGKGRLLVTDAQAGALFRFDETGRRMDVFGTTGSVKLKTPLGVNVGGDGTIFVADGAGQRVVAYDEGGKVVRVFGRPGELRNPTDSALSPDGKLLYVTDSKANRIVVFNAGSAAIERSFGEAGPGDGQVNHPSAVATDRDGNVYVVDAINARIQIFSPAGEPLEQLGSLGIAPGQFIRPKDIAIDATGRVYVTDGAFNNVQIFDEQLRLLTFVGEGGARPGQFQVPGGIAVHGDRFAIVDQLSRRVQLFRHLAGGGKDGDE